jgi:hypothetical protein
MGGIRAVQPELGEGTVIGTGHDLHWHAPIKEAAGFGEEVAHVACRSWQVTGIDKEIGLIVGCRRRRPFDKSATVW